MRAAVHISWRTALAAAIVPFLFLAGGGSAHADGSATIDHVETVRGTVKVLVSIDALDRAAPDLSTVQVALDGEPVDATATSA